MKKILLAVDDSKGSEKVVDRLAGLYSCSRPETVVLLYTEKIEGRSLMDEMLGPSEMSTLKENLRGTEHQSRLDERAGKVLSRHLKALKDRGIENGVKTVVREGHPADEILSVAREEGAEMIIIGSRGKRLHTFLMGSVSREVANRAEVSVLLAR